MTRRLAAILAADMVGYSRMMAEDEDGVIVRLRAVRDGLVEREIAAAAGRLFKTMGDGFLAEFASVVGAARAAVAIQRALAPGGPESRHAVAFRIGVHLGDVVAEGADLLGDGVNIAARLEGMAPPGGICLSRAAWEQLRGKIDAHALPLGPVRLRNIPEPVEVWQIPPSAIAGGGVAGPAIRLSLLGGFGLAVEGRPAALPSAKARLLVARLALAPRGSVAREALAALLWEDAPADQARASLRQALVQVRHALGPAAGALSADAEQVGLVRGSTVTDLAELADAPPEAVLAGLAQGRFAGELLAGVPARGRAIEDWLALEREQARALLLDRLDAASGAALAAGDTARAAEATRHALALEPLHEAAHRRMMEILARRGDTVGALRQFEACRDILRRELGTEPEAATAALASRIRARRRREEPADVARPAPAEPFAEELREVAVVCALAPHDDPETDETAGAAIAAAAARLAPAAGGTPIPSPETDALVVFGAETAGEDDAARALAFARDLLAAAPEARVGVAAGRALVRTGPPLQVTGAARRSAVARALAACPGSIGGAGELAPDAAGGRAAGRPKPPFVGRAAERRQLAALAGAARTDRAGAVALLSGEAGIGKTRLSEEVSADLAAAGWRVVRAGFSGFGEERESFPRRLARALAEAGAPARRTGDTPPLAAARASLLGLEPPAGGAALLAAMTEARIAETEADVLAAMLADAPSGTLLVVEDTHWADRAEIALLRLLADRIAAAPVLLLATERPSEARLAPLLRRAPVEAQLLLLELAPLPDREARRLAAAMGLTDAAFVETALARAEGNALFLVRLLEAGPALDGAPPPSIVSLVQSQLDGLPEADRLALRRAAVLGQSFNPGDFGLVFGPADFRGLVAAGFLADAGERLAFAHALLHEAVYTSITRADRRRLHARAAAHFREDDPVLWADHALLAGDPDAAAACARAADTLLPRYEFARGERYIEEGLSAPGSEGDTRALLLLCRGSLRREGGDLPGALADYEAATAAAESDALLIQTLVRESWVHRLRGDFDRADACLDRAEALRLDAIPPDYQSELWFQRGNQAFARGQGEECARFHARAMTLAERPLWRCRALIGKADADYALGRFASAGRGFAESIEAGRAHGLGLVEMACIFMEPLCVHFTDPGPAAIGMMAVALERTRQAGNARSELLALTGQAEILLLANRLEEAERTLVELDTVLARLGATRFDIEVDYNRGHLALLRGDREGAARRLDALAARITEIDRGHLGPPVLGLAALAAPDPATARARLAEGEAMLAAGAISHCHLWFRLHAIDACLRHGLPAEALRHADALEDYCAVEPCRWTDLVVARGRLLATGAGAGAEAARLADALDAAEMAALSPALRAAIPDPRVLTPR